MGTFGCSVWKSIRRLWPSFRNEISVSVGNGMKIDFWYEVWSGEGSLRDSFPQLYAISLQKEVFVGQVWSPQGWELIFKRAINDWEIGEFARLLEVLHSQPALSMKPDSVRWKNHSKGMFTVKSCYWKLNTLQSLTDIWPWKMAWQTKTPPKVACFAWLVGRRACLTHEVLQKRGGRLAQDVSCVSREHKLMTICSFIVK